MTYDTFPKILSHCIAYLLLPHHAHALTFDRPDTLLVYKKWNRFLAANVRSIRQHKKKQWKCGAEARGQRQWCHGIDRSLWDGILYIGINHHKANVGQEKILGNSPKWSIPWRSVNSTQPNNWIWCINWTRIFVQSHSILSTLQCIRFNYALLYVVV